MTDKVFDFQDKKIVDINTLNSFLVKMREENASTYINNKNVVTNSDVDTIFAGNGDNNTPISKQYLTFVAIEDSSILLSGMNIETGEPDNTIDLQYSKDGSTWTQYEFNPISLSVGETLYMKGNNPNSFSTLDMETSTGSLYTFGDVFGEGNGTSGKYECHGNIMSLLYGDDFEDKTVIPNVACFYGLFIGCTGLLMAPVLPATTLTNYCYDSMFYGCVSLITTPELPATNLASYCYQNMFGDCASLTIAPSILPATTLAESCYINMFYNCNSLTIAPSILPATTLASGCYNSMFYDCSSLTTAPVLPATTLVESCYINMFNGCFKLNNIVMLATDISATDCLTDWVYAVASNGIFTKAPSMTTLPTGSSGIPSGWTIKDYV